MPTRYRAERGRLITISVAALFAMLVMGAASAEISSNPSAYGRTLTRVTAKFAGSRTVAAMPRVPTGGIKAVTTSLRQAATDFDYTLLVCLLFEITLVIFAWRVSLPTFVPIPVRQRGNLSPRAPPSF